MRERLSDLSGAVRRSVQFGGDAGRIHGIPACQARCGAVSRISSPHRQRMAERLIIPTALTCPVGYTEDIFDGARYPGRAADALHLRHSIPRLPRREAAGLEVRGQALYARLRRITSLPYYTLSPTYSVCKNHGYLTGEQFVCPECGEDCGGLQPHHRILPSRSELERRQGAGIQGPQAL